MKSKTMGVGNSKVSKTVSRQAERKEKAEKIREVLESMDAQSAGKPVRYSEIVSKLKQSGYSSLDLVDEITMFDPHWKDPPQRGEVDTVPYGLDEKSINSILQIAAHGNHILCRDKISPEYIDEMLSKDHSFWTIHAHDENNIKLITGFAVTADSPSFSLMELSLICTWSGGGKQLFKNILEYALVKHRDKYSYVQLEAIDTEVANIYIKWVMSIDNIIVRPYTATKHFLFDQLNKRNDSLLGATGMQAATIKADFLQKYADDDSHYILLEENSKVVIWGNIAITEPVSVSPSSSKYYDYPVGFIKDMKHFDTTSTSSWRESEKNEFLRRCLKMYKPNVLDSNRIFKGGDEGVPMHFVFELFAKNSQRADKLEEYRSQ